MLKMFKFPGRRYTEGGQLPLGVTEEDMATRRPRRDFKALYPRDMELELEVSGNPKRQGSQAALRFEKYKYITTVGGALDAGVLYKDIDIDLENNYISLFLPKVTDNE
jgi:hypothetical protein